MKELKTSQFSNRFIFRAWWMKSFDISRVEYLDLSEFIVTNSKRLWLCLQVAKIKGLKNKILRQVFDTCLYLYKKIPKSSLWLQNLKSFIQGTCINVVSALQLDCLPRNSLHTWKTTWQRNMCVQSVRRATATSK